MIAQLNAWGITSPMITSLAITILLAILSFLATRNMKMVPSGLQNLAEWGVESLQNFFTDVMGEHLCKKYLPLIATYFIYILFCNYSGLLPLSGMIPGLKAPTSDFNFPFGIAMVCFFAIQLVAIIENRSVLKAYQSLLLKPVAAIAPLLLIELFVKPVSLSLRLYGNIFGEETVTENFFELCPIGAPVVMNVLSVLMGLVQALVFSLLCATYLTEAGEVEEEEVSEKKLKKAKLVS